MNTEQLSEEHRKYVRTETTIGVVLNVVASAVIAWTVVPKPPGIIPMWGMGGIAFDLVPTTFMIVLMTSIALGIITRKRLAGGKVAPLARAQAGRARMLPTSIPGRAVVLALIACATLLPVTLGLLMLLGVEAMALWPFVLFKAVYGVIVAVIFMPPLLLSALTGRDARAAAASPA
jgi:hypothetical protein